MPPSRYLCGQFEIDIANRRFLQLGREVPIEPRVFAVIQQLLARPGKLVSRHELLDAVWGHRYVTPSTLNRIIGLARRAFCDDADSPQFIQTVHGAGYRYVGPLEAESVDPGVPIARFGPPPIARLPARIDGLIGREAELETLIGMLREGRAVTVLGTGGMGKTQCALEAARRGVAQFADGVWFFDLALCKDGEAWLQALGSALALPAAAVETQLEKIGRFLRDRGVLLVLDNCDRVAGHVGTFVVTLLRSTESVRVLATSQVPLNFSGERLMRVPPLALPVREPAGVIDMEAVARSAAVQMLVTRVRAVQPDFALTPDNAATLVEICHRLDGMPLALELAAPRFALLSPDQVLERLVSRFRFLGSDSAGREARHRSLMALLDWSYSMLSAVEQRLLNWCTVFVESWTMDATIALAMMLGHDAQTAVDLLTGLANRSLVAVIAGTVPPRYRLLETVRDYASERLESTGERGQATAAHLHLVERMCRTSRDEILRGRMRETVAELYREHGNILAALDTALATPGGHVAAMSIVGSLVIYAKARGEYQAVERWCRKAFSAVENFDSEEGGGALLTWGVLQVHLNAGEEWFDTMLPEAIRIAARHNNWWTEAYAHGYLALGLANWGHPDEAQSHVEALTRLVQTHRAGVELLGLAGLASGWIHLSRREPSAALISLRSVRGLGLDVHQDHFIEMYIALAQFETGDTTGAAQQWLSAMDLSLAVTNIRGVAGSMEGCGYLLCRVGDWINAAQLLAAADAIRERTGTPLFSFWLPHRRSALEAIRANLTPEQYAQALRSGSVRRQEDAANEAHQVLARLAGGEANRPAGS